MNEYTYRIETPRDYAAVEALTREAFWNVYRPGCDEHFIVHILRGNANVVARLNYLCECGSQVCGHIFYTAISIISDSGESFEALSFGPISVRPDLQRTGIGSQLIRRSFSDARAAGYKAVIITGNPAYYSRFGFRPAADFGIVDADGSSYPELMACELVEGGLSGVHGRVHLRPEFFDIDAEALAKFDAKFPPREKLKLPGQLWYTQ